jgi:methylenetetrahydrofolate dehydrogenase (NADP+)/methenyltetrahydrofolate cyclohydrolase
MIRLASMLLMQKARGANATVTVCHTGTRDLSQFTRQADILIAATGQPNAITADMVKPGVVVIDVGINRVDDPKSKRGYRIVGDVDFGSVEPKAAAITPVPGGVGPMTVAMLMVNTLKAAQRRAGLLD